jgi:hypothetical protein
MKVFVCGSCKHVRNDRMFMVRDGQGVRMVDECRLCRDPRTPKKRCPCCQRVTSDTDFLLFPRGLPPVKRRSCTSCRVNNGDKETRLVMGEDPPKPEPVIPPEEPPAQEGAWTRILNMLKPAWLRR